AVVVAAVMSAILWQSTGDPDAIVAASQGAVTSTFVEQSKIRVILDVPGVVLIDGITHPPSRDTEVDVRARAEHEVRVKVGGVEKTRLVVPPQDPGAVKIIRLRLGG